MTSAETICAIATAPGGAIGIIRISGSQAFDIVNRIFSKEISGVKPNTMHHGFIINGSETIDEVVISLFKAPKSYTGENIVEISCHGSRYILNSILELLIQQGARLAQPGEFTQRAYLNGKLDLSQAEAVADLIASTNKATHHLAMSQLKGHFSNQLALLRDQLLHLTTLLELELDFSDHEELEFANRDELLNLAKGIERHMLRLVHSFETGQAIKQGIPVAIIGKTNVGKSTLLNQLLKEERAIVSDIHGTTRDTIEDTIDIKGITFRFIDTAGIRQTSDAIEQIGIERTFKTIERARIVLWLIDSHPSLEEIKEIHEVCKDKSLIIIQNKIDKCNTKASSSFLQISAKYGTNLDLLETSIYQAANIPEISENDVIVTSVRHYEALRHALHNIQRVIDSLNQQLSGDLIAEDLRLVLSDLSDITGGAITPQETLNNIFSHFCIGK